MATEKSAEFRHVEDYIAKNVPANPIYELLLSDVRMQSVTKGHVIFRLKMTKAHMNSKGGIHGSVSATIVDWAGGLAIASWDLRNTTGASIDIHVTYQSSVKDGDEVEIEGVAERVGGSIAFTKVNIFKVEDGKRGRAVATGSHTKYVKVP
ncbi:Esterase-like protein 1 [Elsinoe fawcettii]|nr:Esterase-like protein 1 [Elsinoe fawcettii]